MYICVYTVVYLLKLNTQKMINDTKRNCNKKKTTKVTKRLFSYIKTYTRMTSSYNINIATKYIKFINVSLRMRVYNICNLLKLN